RGPLVDLDRGRRDPLQGRGLGVDARRGAAPAGLGRPEPPQPGLRHARHARPLPPAARPGADGVPVRARGERARDPRVRGDRHAAHDHLPEPDLLRRLLWSALALWLGRWALLELASLVARRRPPGPAPKDSPWPPGRMPGPFDRGTMAR